MHVTQVGMTAYVSAGPTTGEVGRGPTLPLAGGVATPAVLAHDKAEAALATIAAFVDAQAPPPA